jgi:hypothetical protein
MPILKKTELDIRTEQLWLALKTIAKSDAGKNRPDLRRDAHATLRDIEAWCGHTGHSFQSLYEYVIGMEEGRADLKAFGPWRSGPQ